MYRAKKENGIELIQINRMQLSGLRQLMTIYKNPTFNLKKELDVSFNSGQGANMKSLTKEYFHHALSVLSEVDPVNNIQLFGGQEGHLVPLYGVDAITSGYFEMAGKLVAHSVLYGGQGLVGLAPAIDRYHSTGSVPLAQELVTLDDLYDVDLKEMIEKQVLSLFSLFMGYITSLFNFVIFFSSVAFFNL